MVSKAALLLSLLPRRPSEFYDRLVHFVVGRSHERERPAEPYLAEDWDVVISALGDALGADLEALSREQALVDLRRELAPRIDDLASYPFSHLHSADITLGLLCYLVCRSLRPATVVETGVAYGMTSAFILQALEVNGEGALHSVDLPPLARQADRYVGALVPNRLRHRWSLNRGTSRRILPRLLKRLGGTDTLPLIQEMPYHLRAQKSSCTSNDIQRRLLFHHLLNTQSSLCYLNLGDSNGQLSKIFIKSAMKCTS